MKELLSAIVLPLVDNPMDVEITESEKEDGEILLSLKVASSDMGKVIGRQGRIAKAIRTVMKAAANKDGKKVAVEIVE
ncbi:MAG: KH domain-containing protein [Clostridia bacterium]|nr:KH domain-containing protein [Clostridia bacterium]